METQNYVHEIREQRGISAADLAKLTGVSRQTIYALEAGDYVPNTTLALQLAKILEVQVEDLFRLESGPAAAPLPLAVDVIAGDARKGQPVQLCRVGNRIIGVSASPPPLTLPTADGVVLSKNRVHPFQSDVAAGKRVLIAGCDPGISVLAQHLARFDDVDMIVASASSRRALDWLKQGKVHVAGSHLRDASSGEYNLPIVRRLFTKHEVKVVTFAIWEQGLVLQSGNPKNIRGVADLSRKDVRITNREKGAGSRALLDEKLHASRIPAAKVSGYDRIAHGHLPAALAVNLGEADCCIATRSAARAFGLSFIPLATERYDLVIRRAHLQLPAVKSLLEVLSRSALRRQLEFLAGYDTRHTGEVVA